MQKVGGVYTGLPPRSLISAFDFSGAGSPVPAGSVDLGGNPRSMQVSPGCKGLVTTLDKAGFELASVILDQWRPGQVRAVALESGPSAIASSKGRSSRA